MDSPRVAWCKRHRIRLHFAPHCTESPWCAWLPENDAYPELRKGDNYEGVPNRPDDCGYGCTDEEAIVQLAQVAGLQLWNEEASP